MLMGMTKMEKVTVSLPASLLAFVERQRALTGATRSETVAGMLSEVQRRIELAGREARYSAAYALQPETSEERAFTDAASADLFDDAPSRRGRKAVARKPSERVEGRGAKRAQR